MPDVVAKMPDKGEGTRRSIEKQLAEKRVLEAEYNAKYADSETFYTPQSSPKGSLGNRRLVGAIHRRFRNVKHRHHSFIHSRAQRAVHSNDM